MAMLKSEIIDYLQSNVIGDILYTEKFYERDGKNFIECFVSSASCGYSMSLKKEYNSINNRNFQIARDLFSVMILGDSHKFVPRFDYTEDPLEGLDVLFSDGFNYEDFN